MGYEVRWQRRRTAAAQHGLAGVPHPVGSRFPRLAQVLQSGSDLQLTAACGDVVAPMLADAPFSS